MRETLGTLTRVLDGEGFWSDKGVHGGRGYGEVGEDYRFVMIAASTPLRTVTWKVLGNLGPRLLTLSLQQPGEPTTPPEAGYRKRVDNARIAIDEFMKALWDQHGYRGVTWESTDPRGRQELWNLASLVAKWRAPLPEPGEPPVFERPFRLFDSLYGVVRGHALLDERLYLNDDDYRLVRRLALDSMPENRRRLLRALLTVGSVTPEEAANSLGMTAQAAVDNHLNHLTQRLGILVRTGGGARGDPFRWRLADQALVAPWEQQWLVAVTQ